MSICEGMIIMYKYISGFTSSAVQRQAGKKTNYTHYLTMRFTRSKEPIIQTRLL